jgi:chromosome segregation ATPase
MEWLKDNTNIWIVIALLIICFFWAMSSTLALNKTKAELQQNLGTRLSLEEKYDFLVKTKVESDAKLEQLQGELEQSKKLYADALSDLNQQKLTVKALQAELEKTVKQLEKAPAVAK